MIAGLRAWWRGLRHYNHRGYIYIWANVAAVVASLPIITAPAAWLGLCRLSYLAYRSPQANLTDFWEGFRANLVRGAVLALINAALFVVIGTNALVAFQRGEGATLVLHLIVLLVWLAVQFYATSLFYALENPTLIGAFRNGAVMLLRNPFFTLGLWVGVLLTIAFSIVFPVAFFLLTFGALAAVGAGAVADRLRAVGFDVPMGFPEEDPNFVPDDDPA